MIAPNSNWDQCLTPAPCAIALLGDLILKSADTDFSLDEKPPTDGFKLLRYPNLFRTSLVQNEFQKLEVAAYKALGRNQLENKSPHLSKMPSQSGSSSAVTAAIANARYKIKLAKETLRDAKLRQEKSDDELRESNEKLTKVLIYRTQLESKKINFASIRESLVKGISALAEEATNSIPSGGDLIGIEVCEAVMEGVRNTTKQSFRMDKEETRNISSK
ncbi:unnamed protein product [Mytilus edulis]|uniref:Uncharacterized protein n=1 Tax=Mytilus edulis TaxID=6550 RepID=A0A8S3V3K1_MYTED|nr:unnamed protein product [Mytilus edulis]